MSTITYHLADGGQCDVETAGEISVMRAALSSGVPGIVGECGGQAMCATCHVYVHEDYLDRLPEISEDEDEMLEVTSSERDERCSRLSCQITVGGELEGLAVTVPPTQV